MDHDTIRELAAASRARNEERKAAKNAALAAPLKGRIAELEALLDEAVKRWDALEAHVKELEAKLDALETPDAAAETPSGAKRKGR